VLSGEATNTNCIVFGLTRPELEPTVYRIRGEHANHYISDAVDLAAGWLRILNDISITTMTVREKIYSSQYGNFTCLLGTKEIISIALLILLLSYITSPN
jgi:hypothetical protein